MSLPIFLLHHPFPSLNHFHQDEYTYCAVFQVEAVIHFLLQALHFFSHTTGNVQPAAGRKGICFPGGWPSRKLNLQSLLVCCVLVRPAQSQGICYYTPRQQQPASFFFFLSNFADILSRLSWRLSLKIYNSAGSSVLTFICSPIRTGACLIPWHSQMCNAFF